MSVAETLEVSRNLQGLSYRHSGEPGVLAKVGGAFLQKGLFAFGSFFGHVVKQGGISGEFLESGLTVAVGIESGLEAADGDRAFL